MRHHAPSTATRTVLATLIAGIPAGIAAADIAYSSYTDSSTFAFIVQDMPDFDQVRAGDLPNNGVCYCGPASTSDLLGYVATHGFGDVEPGIPFISWFTPSSYAEISDLMATIGTSTGTSSGAGGTSCGVGQSALEDELIARLGDRFTVRNSYFNSATGYAPSTAEVAFRGKSDQAVGLMLFGRWTGEFDGDTWKVANGWSDRRGGHFEAVNRAIAGGGLIKLGLRNPAGTTDSTTSQSEFATHWFDVTRRDVEIFGNELVIDQLNGTYTSGGELRMRIFEGYLSIAPKAAYSWDEFTPSILRLTPTAPLWSIFGASSTTTKVPAPPTSVAFGPSDLEIAAILDGKVVRIERGPFPFPDPRELPIDLPEWMGASDLAFDADRRLHAVGGDLLVSWDWDDPRQPSVFRLPGEGTSIAIENGIVHVLVPEMEMVVAVNRGKKGPFAVELPLPDDALVLASSTIDMLPGGRLFLLSDGILNPMQIVDGGFQRLGMPIPRDGEWVDLAVDDNDTLCLLDGQGLVEAHRVGPNGFERDTRHALDGLIAGKRIAVARSTSNAYGGSELLIDETDADLDDREVELDCLGDLNFDREVDAADIGLLLGDWGASRSIADLDRNGTVDASDLGLMLGAFGRCP